MRTFFAVCGAGLASALLADLPHPLPARHLAVEYAAPEAATGVKPVALSPLTFSRPVVESSAFAIRSGIVCGGTQASNQKHIMLLGGVGQTKDLDKRASLVPGAKTIQIINTPVASNSVWIIPMDRIK